MNKNMAFLEVARVENPHRDVQERVKDMDSILSSLSSEQRRLQAQRCMKCGVPFCQSGIEMDRELLGCPLHNLIPEWNDLLSSDDEDVAYDRLMKTNNFPEFTGRVCPAPCEKACNCRRYGGAAVTIKENELCIIEHAFKMGKVKPRTVVRRSGRKVAVIGSGPAGLACADQLNHRGHEVTVYEKNKTPGGLLTYGIPSMKLPKDVVKRRIVLMSEEGVRFVTDTDAAKIAEKILNEYDAVVLCCGAPKQRRLGFDMDSCKETIYGSDYLFAMNQKVLNESSVSVDAKDKDVLIIGNGDTASDCLAMVLRQGCRSVHQLIRRPMKDYLDENGHLPMDYAHEEALVLLQEDPRCFQTQVKELRRDSEGHLKGILNSRFEEMPCDLLIAATGFDGCDPQVAEAFGVQVNRVVTTEAGSYATNVENVFTAGDMHSGASLVVCAIAEGRRAAAQVDTMLNGFTNLE